MTIMEITRTALTKYAADRMFSFLPKEDEQYIEDITGVIDDAVVNAFKMGYAAYIIEDKGLFE